MNALLRLLPIVRPYWLRVFEAGLCMLFTTLLALPMPLMSIYIIDQLGASMQMHVLYFICGALLLSIVLGLSLGFAQRYLLLVFTRRVFFDLEIRLFQTIHRAPIAFFRRNSAGYLATRISDDVRQLGALMAGTYIEGVSALVLLCAALGIMLAIHPLLALIVAGVSPGFAWINLHFGRQMQLQSERVQERKGLANAVRLESLEAAPVVRAFELGRRETRRLTRRLRDEVDVRLRRDTTIVGAQLLQLFLYSTAGLFLLGYGAGEIMRGKLSLGQFVAFNTLLAYVYGPMNQLSALYIGLRQGVGVLNRVVEILDTPPEQTRLGHIGRVASGEVMFGNVCFAYDLFHPLLHEVHFSLPPGSITALVGPSGAGKTTLVNLLLRFYPPLGGCIRIDGVDIQTLDLRVLRASIGWVGQEIRLFSGTLRANIAYGKSGATSQEVTAAAELMNCMEFVQRFPAGLDTWVGPGGVQLSGGQQQRIALARAIVRDPRILVLDEATGSLDANAERLVQTALQRAARGRTTWLIAHRLSTLAIADRICVLAGGRIVEQGTLTELLERDSHFRRYVQPVGQGMVG